VTTIHTLSTLTVTRSTKERSRVTSDRHSDTKAFAADVIDHLSALTDQLAALIVVDGA
jgi:hypothetical protein